MATTQPPSPKRGTKRRIYDFVVGPKFPLWRLCTWLLQVPVAVTYTALAQSVTYVVILSLAALIESALTDVVEAWKFEKEQDNDGDEPSEQLIGRSTVGRQFVTEEEKDLTLPDDSIHLARLLEVKERTFEFTDRNDGTLKTSTTLEWWFEVTQPMAGLDSDYIGRRVKGECKPKLSSRPGNRFREWAEALLDREIPIGTVVDIDDLVGLQAEIVIGHRKDRKDPNKVWEEVVGVLPGGPPSEPPF